MTMTSIPRRRRRALSHALATGTLVFLLLSGCSDDEGPAASDDNETPTASPAATPSDDTDAVIEAMDAWAAADTPETACALASLGFATFIGDGDPDQCEEKIPELGELVAQTVTVVDVAFEGGQALVRATAPEETEPTTYYFVQEGDAWKLNSIGERHEAIG